MTQKLSSAAFHHGNVQGCVSASADLLIQEIPSGARSAMVAWAGVEPQNKAQEPQKFVTFGLYFWPFYRGGYCYTCSLLMRIDQQKCVACGNCIAVYPMGAISIDRVKNRAHVNADECVECYTCFRGMSME